MEIVLAGAGNVACSLGPALAAAGHDIAAVASRTMESAQSLASCLHTRACQGIPELETLAGGIAVGNIGLVCVAMLKDDVLQQQARELVRALGTGTLFLHTAGSVPASVWKDAGAVHYGVMYPMTSFSKSQPVDMKGVPLFVEASDPESLDTVMGIARSISDSVTELDSDGRLYLHLAAVFVNNFSCHMMAVGQQLLERHGVDFKVMLPLVKGAVEKLESMTPMESQTGPAIRGDVGVVRHHMEMLASDPAWREIYRIVTKDINPNIQTDD